MQLNVGRAHQIGSIHQQHFFNEFATKADALEPNTMPPRTSYTDSSMQESAVMMEDACIRWPGRLAFFVMTSFGIGASLQIATYLGVELDQWRKVIYTFWAFLYLLRRTKHDESLTCSSSDLFFTRIISDLHLSHLKLSFRFIQFQCDTKTPH